MISRYMNNSRYEREVNRLTLREVGYRHPDASERGRLLAEIFSAVNDRTLFGDEAHTVLGLPQGSLDDGTLPTARLTQARDAIKAMPNVEMNLNGRHSTGARTVWP